MKTTCTKTWPSIPFAHRAPNHDGHCRLIHGHNWTLSATFEAIERDENGFVLDFGKLKEVKRMLDDKFDHALVLNESDPERVRITESLGSLARVVTVPDCSCEGLALFALGFIDGVVSVQTKGRVRCASVTLFEDEKNSATVTR